MMNIRIDGSNRTRSTNTNNALNPPQGRHARRVLALGLALIGIALFLFILWQNWNGAPRAFGQTNSPASATVLIEGTPELYNVLTVTISDLQDADGVPDDPAFTYQWYWDERPVSKPTGSNLDVNYRSIGKQIWVRVQFLDSAGNLETLDSLSTEAIPGGADIVGARGIYFGETIMAYTATVNYPDLSSPPNYRYQWIYWDEAHGTKQSDISGANGPSYDLDVEDLGKVIHLELTYDSTEGGTRTKLANFRTFPIGHRTLLDAPFTPIVTSQPNGASLTLSWNRALVGGIAAIGYAYRFRPVGAEDFEGPNAIFWRSTPNDGAALSVTIDYQFINDAEYLFEVRPYFDGYRQEAYLPIAVTGTYHHRTRGC